MYTMQIVPTISHMTISESRDPPAFQLLSADTNTDPDFGSYQERLAFHLFSDFLRGAILFAL
jgi:hypothetical protein